MLVRDKLTWEDVCFDRSLRDLPFKIELELALETEDSTKVPDVVWASEATIARRLGEISWVEAPEICVEVLSPANTVDEMDQKRALYFERHASEVWLCSWDGNMTFYGTEGKLKNSTFCPTFPGTIVL